MPPREGAAEAAAEGDRIASLDPDATAAGEAPERAARRREAREPTTTRDVDAGVADLERGLPREHVAHLEDELALALERLDGAARPE